MNTTFPVETHRVDVCVVGGGMAGLTAAVAAARHGARVLLMHERPVLGGNASSEVRVHVCGADRHNEFKNLRETGILEEIRLDNLARNPKKSYSIWDTVLYEKAFYQPGLTTLLNCSCLDAVMDGDRIVSVTGWQCTTQTYHTVEADIFVDCSGDAILAPLTGADWRKGREGRDEFGESHAPETADLHTMGMTCLFSAREYDTPQPFTPPAWAYRLDEDDLPYGSRGHGWIQMGYWWIELGGEHDSIRDTELLRDELLKLVYGVWDHIKNRGEHGAENWALEWVQFLPGKRESRRYLGDHILTQNDVLAEGKFDDIVAYGGWTMDDHHFAGIRSAKLHAPMTIFHDAPSPFGIPYRALYSRNIANLMFAGRNASCTHMAMSSTRVMGTGCSMGQAVGTAAALAVREGITPRAVAAHLPELQQTLLRDDAYLPWMPLAYGPLTTEATLTATQGDPAPLRDGINRPVGDDLHAWVARPGDAATYAFAGPRPVRQATLVLDSALDCIIAMSEHQRDNQYTSPPPTLPKTLRLDGRRDGAWTTLHAVEDNHQRLLRLPVEGEYDAIRVTIAETRGAETTRVFAFYLD
jgi:hypothetical protein